MVKDLPRSVAVLGAGAVGCLVGATLAAAHLPVTLVGRPEAMRTIRELGLTLERPWRRSQTLHDLEAVGAWDELSPLERRNVGLVVLTTKAYDTAAIAGLERFIAPEVPLVVLQNGVGGAELARELAPERPVLAGVITLVATLPRPGVVRSLSRNGGIGLAPVNASPADLAWAAALLRPGFTVRAYANYRDLTWSKLLLNLLGNAVPAIVRRPPERVFADLALCRLEVAAYREALAVMHRQRILPVDLPGYPVRTLAWALERLPLTLLHRALPAFLARGRGGKRPSLQIDLERGRRQSEVEFLNGAVVRMGRTLGVPAPANALIYRTLTAMAQGTIPLDAYAQEPHALLAPLR